MDRREFLKAMGGTVLAGASSAYAVRLLTNSTASDATAEGGTGGRRWGMVVNLNKCRSDCTACLEACRKENNVAHHGDKRWDVHWIRKVKLENRSDGTAAEKPVLLLCNHCDKPPCAQVCPVCAHLLERGRRPACVEACAKINVGALTVGDLNDSESEISRLISSNSVKRIREDLGTEPKVYYIGL